MTAAQLLSFRLPDLGEGVMETEIVRWLVAVGDSLTEDQPMVEVMTDKATVEIPAPAAGTVEQICAAEGEVVPVGSVIITIATAHSIAGIGSARAATRTDTNGAAADTAQSSAASTVPADRSQARVQATPLVRKVAAELGVDLSSISGTGPAGRITEADVRASVAGDPAASDGAGAPTRGDSGTTAPARIIALRGARGQIASHLERAAQVPTVTVVEEADLTRLETLRSSSGIGFVPYVVQAVVAGMRAVPEMNATLDDERREVTIHDQIDLGIAVQTDRGLVVPVLRDCASLSLEEIDQQVTSLAERARHDSLSPGDFRGGTFTLTSAGKLGGLFTTPLLNVPQVGILGLHRAEQRAVVRDGAVAVATMANLSITFDHRALDGVYASRFVLAVIESMQIGN